VELVAKGHSNREIAEQLHISDQGVRYHLNQVYQKLGLESREALVAWHRARPGRIHAPFLALASLPKGLAGFGSLKVASGVLAATAALAVGLGLASQWSSAFRGDQRSASPSCGQHSQLIPDGWSVTCLETLADLEAVFRRQLYPSDMYPKRPRELIEFAILESPDGERASFVRWSEQGNRLSDEVSGEFETLVAYMPFGLRLAEMAARGRIHQEATAGIFWATAAAGEDLPPHLANGAMVLGFGGPGVINVWP